MSDRSHLSPEQRASADLCDQFTDAILASTAGMPVGVVLGACMNVMRTAATYLPADMRKMLADRLRGEVAADIEAMKDAQPESGSAINSGAEPGSGSERLH